MTAKQRDEKLTQIAFQIGIRDVMLHQIEREKADLLAQYETTQKATVTDESAPEHANG